jgi:nitric oxide reductase subunit C
MLTIDSLAAISAATQHIDYRFDSNRGFDLPVIGAAEPLFGKSFDEPAAATLIDRGKMVTQSRACIDCHTFFGNRAYYAPDLKKTERLAGPSSCAFEGLISASAPPLVDRAPRFLAD